MKLYSYEIYNIFFFSDEYRKDVDLPELEEDPIEIIKSMRSSSPPPSTTDLMNAQKRGTRQKRVCKVFNFVLV